MGPSCCMLQYCIREKHYFSVSDLNEAIEGMELGYMESDQPAPITSHTIFAPCSNSLKQKGMSPHYLPDMQVTFHVFQRVPLYVASNADVNIGSSTPSDGWGPCACWR